MSSQATFLSHVADNYEEIRRNFKKGLSKMKYTFDEDLFSDTILKCNCKFENKLITKDEALKYFWVAYLNSYKNDKKKYAVKNTEPIPDNFNIIDSRPEYNYELDDTYNNIIDAMKQKFGEKNTDAWVKHILFKKPYNKMLEDNEIPQNFHYIIKKIKKFLQGDIKNNPEIINMVNEMRTT